MVNKQIKNFIYPDIKDSDRSYAGVSEIVREDGNWLDYLPPIEDQNIRGIESSACYIEAQQHTIATLLEEKFDIKDSNFSARFNALLSNGTEEGGDPIKGAKSIKFDGLIPQTLMDFGDDIQSWDDFHSWKGVNQNDCISKGKDFAGQWDMSFKIVVEKDMPLQTKYTLLRQALKISPCPISVYAWVKNGEKYIKPDGVRDNHLVEAVMVDENNRITIRDTYAPYQKTLAPNFDFEFAMSYTLQKKTQQNLLSKIKQCLTI